MTQAKKDAGEYYCLLAGRDCAWVEGDDYKLDYQIKQVNQLYADRQKTLRVHRALSARYKKIRDENKRLHAENARLQKALGETE